MSEESEIKIRDADILYLYDVKLANPNGDPDEENRPRMDEITRRALVSDVRLKRYFRDYWLGKGLDIWVRTGEEGEVYTATQRIGILKKEFDISDVNSREFFNKLLERLIDIRLFGATIPIKGKTEGEAGESHSLTGPVQFSWGYSLHPVEIVLSSTITSMFAGREKGEKGYLVYLPDKYREGGDIKV